VKNFSSREKEIIKIIGRRKITISKIREELFKGKNKPLDANINVGNSVIRIIKKCEHYDLSWTYEKKRVLNKMIITRIKKDGTGS
jgi:hypothetical protein